MVMPGDNAAVAVRLDKPAAFDIGSHFPRALSSILPRRVFLPI